MSAQKAPPIIIIKKKGGHGHGHHGGAWKVAYADFVTAMMAFFLVMWIVGQGKETTDGVAAYFRDPGAFEGGTGILDGVERGTTGGGHPGNARPNVDAAEAALEEAAQQLRHALEALPGFAAIQDRVDIQVTSEGLRIELREAPNDGFFATGSDVLKPEAVEVLGVVGTELGKLGRGVAIEGHTDSRPYSGGSGYTNWELSADRANSARRVLEAGLQAGQIEAVRGYADTQLRVAADRFDASNRRISVIVRR
ncbi:MAG: flagellar motor protein MotB [Vicinamibacterales bacterium]